MAAASDWVYVGKVGEDTMYYSSAVNRPDPNTVIFYLLKDFAQPQADRDPYTKDVRSAFYSSLTQLHRIKCDSRLINGALISRWSGQMGGGKQVAAITHLGEQYPIERGSIGDMVAKQVCR